MKQKNPKKSSTRKNAGERSSDSKALAVPGVDLRQLEQLLAFMSQNGLEEFEYASGDLRIRLKKAFIDPNSAGTRALPPRPDIVVPREPAANAPAAPAPEPSSDRRKDTRRHPETPAAAEEETEDLHVIKSPIVGTYYASPSPDAGPFIKAGDDVAVGQVVCIIEAMKLMNEIEADVGGEVVRVFMENGQPVEYGEPLFSLRPAGKK
jgi:acetyl-CoA carboxylase biotin carboxyl carrier protein